MKYFEVASLLQSLQEAEIVGEMLDHIQHQNQIKEPIRLRPQLRKLKVDCLAGPGLGKVDGLRRDVVSPEAAFAVEARLKLFKHFSNAASHVADGFRRYTVLP